MIVACMFALHLVGAGPAGAAGAAEEGANSASETEAESGTEMQIADLPIRFSGFVQTDAVFVNQLSADELDAGSGEPLNQLRFFIRHARLRARAGHELPFLRIGLLLELDANTVRGPALFLQKAEVSTDLPGEHPVLGAAIGLMKIPFGGELLDEPMQRIFAEQALMSRALFPGEHDLGLRIGGEWRALRWTLAAMNGNPSAAASFALQDPNAGKDVVGRVGVDTDVITDVRLRAGVSGLSGVGFHPGQRATKDSLVWRDQNEDGIAQAAELGVVPAAAATPSQAFRRSAIGADGRVTWAVPGVGPLLLEGELTLASNLDRAFLVADPIATGRDVRELGYRLLATQELSPWIVVGVRYDEFNPDLDLLDQRAGRTIATDPTISTWSFAVVAQLPRRARLLFEYDHEDNAIGRTAAGVPTSLPADRFFVRAQGQF